jgi:predicted RNase H-like HicB family nuclease
MPRNITLNISLTTTMKIDNTTGNYVIYYNEFPQAIATGPTEGEAEKNLAFLVEQMWERRSDDLKKYLWENYKENIQIKAPA